MPDIKISSQKLSLKVNKKEVKSTNRTKQIETFLNGSSLRYNPVFKDITDIECNNPYQWMSDHLNYGEIEDIVEATGLRVRLFLISGSCDNWHYKRQTLSFFSSLKFIDFFNESPQEVVFQLSNSKFIGYASVVIIVHRISYLIGILEAMEHNQFLRYKSKFILCRHERSPSSLVQRYTREKMQYKLNETACIVKEADRFIKGVSGIILRNRNATNRDVDENNNGNTFTPMHQIDNLLLLHWMEEDVFTACHGYACVLYATFSQPYCPLKKTLKDSFKHLIATPNADLYSYSINPALAIIINNYYFTDPFSVREGSEHDVVRLIRELKIAAIPYIVIEDCNQRELLEILDYMQNKDFYPLTSLLVFVMSHGDSNDIIYTHDGQLNIKEHILKCLQANKSLENSKLHLAINACRGPIDMDYADKDDFDDIRPTDNSDLNENSVILYSVPNNVQSLRSPEDGCPFVQSFCRHFRHIQHTDDVRVLEQKINSDLSTMDYFRGLEKCMELVATDNNQQHCIRHPSSNVSQLWKLYKSISEEFPRQEHPLFLDGGSSFICGVLNVRKFRKESCIQRYFADELEWDNFSIRDY